MLNIFPIQFLAPIAYLILRLCIGIIFVQFGFKHIRARHELKKIFVLPHFHFGLFFAWYVGVVEIIIGTLFILGLFTQIAALLTMAYTVKLLIMYKQFAHPLLPRKQSLILLFAIAVALFITGAGALAFDLPI